MVCCVFLSMSVRRREGEIWPHSGYWPAGVLVLRRHDVRLGVTCLCPEDGGLLRVPVRQRHRRERHANPRSVWFPLPLSGKMNDGSWKKSLYSCRLQWAGRAVLPHFHHRLLREQLLLSAIGFLLRLLRHHGGTTMCNVSPTLALTSVTGRKWFCFFWFIGMSGNSLSTFNVLVNIIFNLLIRCAWWLPHR